MSRLKEKFNLRSIFYLTTIIVLLIGLIIIVILKSINVIDKKIYTDNYDIYYDSTWRIINKDKDNITLRHNTASTLKIKITTLKDYYKYEGLSSSINNILFSIKKENNNIQLINKEAIKINNNDAYKILYDYKDKNILITVMKESDKLVLFEYTAKDKYFDMVLDSANNIVNRFRLSHKKNNLTNVINIDKSNIKWRRNRNLDSKLINTNDYSISNNNYKVYYKIPNIFKETILDSTKSNFEYDKITISTSVETKNIYEYINNNKDKNTVYYKYAYLNKKTKYKEYLNQVEENTYCYKNEYYRDKKIYENVELIYQLNKNHIFIVRIESKESNITKKLIKAISLTKYENYSSNTKRKIISNKLIGNLIEYTNYKKEKVEEIIIKLPITFKEIDHNNNMYSIRYYEDNSVGIKAKYYKISNIDKNNKSINNNYMSTKSFGPYKELTKEENKVYNNREYIVYSGSYTNKQRIVINTKVLYYELKDKYLVIEIESINDINEIIQDMTDIDVL